MRASYTTVKIPAILASDMDILRDRLGYASRADMVNDAIRRFLESAWIEQNLGNEKKKILPGDSS